MPVLLHITTRHSSSHTPPLAYAKFIQQVSNSVPCLLFCFCWPTYCSSWHGTVAIIIIIMINRLSGNDDWPGGKGGTSSIIKEALGDGMCGFIIIFGSYSVRDKCGCILLLASQPPPRAVDQWRSLISLVA